MNQSERAGSVLCKTSRPGKFVEDCFTHSSKQPDMFCLLAGRIQSENSTTVPLRVEKFDTKEDNNVTPHSPRTSLLAHTRITSVNIMYSMSLLLLLIVA